MAEDLKKSSSNNIRQEIISNNVNIKLTDTDIENNLQMYCYINCNNESNDIIKKSRGLIFHDGKLIVKSLGYSEIIIEIFTLEVLG